MIELKILPDNKLIGKLKISPSSREIGKFHVEFDAEDPKSINSRFIYDITTMSAREIEKWTGVNPRTLFDE